MGKAKRIKRHTRELEQKQSQVKPASYSAAAFWLICAVLVVATLAVYVRATTFPLTNCDDQMYITNNADVRAGLTREAVHWAFANNWYAANWHPLTWLSHMLDCSLFGLDKTRGIGPGGHHAVSILLHILNTLLVFLVFTRMTRHVWRSAFVAALVALHPQPSPWRLCGRTRGRMERA